MSQIEKIKEELQKLKPFLMDNYKIKELGIFGSYVKDKQKSKSDLDILVDFYIKPDLFTYIEIQNFLSKKLRAKVDLVMKSALKKYIAKAIKKEVIYI